MKKVLVLLLTGFSILALFVVFASSSRRYAASADALAGNQERDADFRFKKGMTNSFEEGAGYDAPAPVAVAPGAPPPPAMEALGSRGSGRGAGGNGLGLGGLGKADDGSSEKKPSPKKMKEQEETEAPADEAGGPAPTRAWFPETFLFEPLVVTDSNGRATVPVKVP
ncbi:MAG: hypothetical protein SFW67_03745, partial [Myxococcaceae bacterium]|nr:hypothetical protein [Myxococcaceae bacterium]